MKKENRADLIMTNLLNGKYRTHKDRDILMKFRDEVVDLLDGIN